MNKAITESVAIINEYKASIEKELIKLSDTIKKMTDGLLSLCDIQTTDRIQLYYNRDEGTVDDALRVIRDLADNGMIIRTWSAKRTICYTFYIDHIPFCIVVDKEGRE